MKTIDFTIKYVPINPTNKEHAFWIVFRGEKEESVDCHSKAEVLAWKMSKERRTKA